MSEMIKLVDVTKCDGCRACMVSCKNWNDLPAEPEAFQGSVQSHEKLTAHTWNVLTYNEQETANGGFEWLFRHSACLHCKDAGCEKVCPEVAIKHTDLGTVVIDHDKCVGCGYCTQNCPFGVIQLGTEIDSDGKEVTKASKCDLCTGRLEQGLKPACVTACHTDSLVYGDRDTLMKQAEERLVEMKKRFPNAQIYDTSGVGGSKTIYLLADKPPVYGLPEHPNVPLSAVIWKDYAQPLGKMMLGATTMAVVGAYISNRVFNKEGYRKYEEVYLDQEGDNTDEKES